MTITDRTITAPEETLALPAGPAVAHRPLGVCHPASRQRGLEELAVHRRPQAHRHHVRRGGHVLLLGGAGPKPCSSSLQLATPNGSVIGAGTYNGVFTMHGVTMVFLVIMPMAAAFANYLLPLQVGGPRRGLPPRLNAFSFLVLLGRRPAARLLDLHRRLVPERPRRRLVQLRPQQRAALLTVQGDRLLRRRLADHRYRVSGQLSINLIVTVLNMRTKGMSFFRMPVLTWMLLITPVPAAVRHPGHHRGPVLVDVRPAVGRQLLQRGGRGRPRFYGSTCSGYSAIPRCIS